jgi:putative ABC transport system substrate-binding protein
MLSSWLGGQRVQFDQLRRREFITLLGGAAAWPLAARAQQPAMPVVGFLESGSAEPTAQYAAAFRRGLDEYGYVEGQNITIEYRFAENRYDRLPGMADDLVRRQVNAIAAFGSAGATAAKAATTTIPIIFVSGADPVRLGLVASLSRPGGNLTGVSQSSMEVGPKRLQLLHELIPTATTIALLVNPTSPIAETLSKDSHEAASTLGLRLNVFHASSERDLTTAFTALVQLRTDALVIGPDSFFNSYIEQLAALTLRHALPTMYQYREFAVAGGLMSYGGSLTDVFRRAGAYTGRILKGERTADLPVQQSTKIELIINLKTAKALGLNVPLTLLGRADEVIE